jgi:putative Ca2+/H+ antiporter (TMEM165/GDT1 family)
MENLDLIIFSVILIVLFIIFGIATLIEFNRMSNEPFNAAKDKGGVETLKNFIGKFLGSVLFF